ncbi:MAG TPA: Rne/Rng family ribonuclease [Bryobacteraceae bacterium]|nr:Rne/Rng family ribonuclease [Bryobacteraceae bacterium]
MSKELIVAAGRHETRVAILEDDQLVEVFHEREKEYSLAGSIHKGRVTRVLPGMQSAFVDIGLERDAFLYVSDFFEDTDEYDAVVSTAEDKVMKLEKSGGASLPGEARAMAAPATAEAVATEEAPPAEGQPPREGRPDGRGEHDGRREHGRRGRRGRRRGGRGGGGLPESKYFTPGAERQTGSVETRAEEPEEEAEEPVSAEETRPAAESQPYERLVLPGESLAKYSAPPHEAAAPSAPEAAEAAEIEPAIPVDHHLAGLVWATPSPILGAASEDGPVVEAIAEAEPVKPELIPTPDGPAEGLSPEDEEQILAAAEAVEAIQEEAIDEIAIGVPPADIDDEAEAVDSDDESAEAVAESETEPESVVAAAAGEEGPEPARTPVSLTATLREQGHRYPHRVSRRSRRRGGRNRGGEDRGPRPNAEQPGTEAAQVAVDRIADADEAAIDAALASPDNGQAVLVEEKAPAVREDRRSDRERGRERGRGREGRREGREREERERPVLPSISDLLKEGQEIIVQISKEPLGQKGARITSHIALPGRFVVYMPTVDHAGVSRKIPSEEERHRLKKVLQTHRQGIPGGYICRTAAEGKSEEELRSDMHFLYNLWLDMRQKAEKKPAPVLLHHDLDLVQRILRDQLTTSFKTIWVDNEEHYESILRFVERFQPALVGRVKLYTRENPIFDEFGITAELEKALRPKVWLKSGGYIVINQTEALVAIDINTGKYVGKSNRLEDTIVKINTDAIREIVRQIRLRDLGGIIVVDFIDMDERKNRQKVMAALEDAMRVDRAPYKILQFNDFGLVAITRKRVKQSLERTLCAPCSYCEGAGYIKSPQTVITEILSEAQRMRKALAGEKGNVVLRVNPEVAKMLKSNHNSYLQEVEEILGKTVMVKSDPLLHQTKFDLA